VRLDRRWIAARIPHTGGMCLLDEVIDWNTERICCRSGTHRHPDNPLRADGRLGAACAVEYAAQAAAVHGSLTRPASEGTPDSRSFALLASVRDLQLRVAWLDDVEENLICEATLIAGDPSARQYAFTVCREGESAALAAGRFTIMTGTRACAERA